MLLGRRKPQRGLTASAARATINNSASMQRLIQPAQERALAYYDNLGPIKFAGNFYSRALTKLRIFPAYLDENGEPQETEDAAPRELLDRVQDPNGGRTNLFGTYGRLRFLVGESYLVCSYDADAGEKWEMLSFREIQPQGTSGAFIRKLGPNLGQVELRPIPDDSDTPTEGTAAVYRLWRPHPTWSQLADSPMLAALDDCEELLLSAASLRSRMRSRLAGNGMLVMADSISPPPLEPVGDEDILADPFYEDFVEHITAPIKDEGSAAGAAPFLARVPDDMVANGFNFISFQDKNEEYRETGIRTEAIRRLGISLDLPLESLLGLSDSSHWCADDKTEILTADGWLLHDDLSVGAEVLTLNHKTGASEWQEVEDVARFEVDDLPMLEIESRYHSSLTTLNHRWPVLGLKQARGETSWEREWKCSEDLRTTHRLVTAAACADIPEEPEFPDALVELVGWLWTEGSVREREGRIHPRVSLYQSHKANPDNVLRIRSALSALYGAGDRIAMPSSRRGTLDERPRWRETTHGDKTVFSLNVAAAAQIVEHAPGRVVSSDFIRRLTAAQLGLFIDTSIRGDGSLMGAGTRIIGQSDPARLAGFELAVILSGRSPISYTQTHEGFTRHTQHYVSVSDRQTVRLKKASMRETRYSGTVWCPVTGNSSWLARRNGKVFFTGNTAWQVDEQAFKVYLQPVCQELVDDLTSAYLRPAARDAGIANWEKLVVGYDAAEIINHPDRGKDALDLYNARAIGKASLRDAKGFDDDDAPEQAELDEMIGVAIRDGSYAKYGIPGVRTGGIEPLPGEIENAGGSSDAPTGPTSGSEVEQGPPPGGPDAVISSGHERIIGAAELAVERARSLAGARLRRHSQTCAPCKLQLADVAQSMVASALGLDKVRDLNAPSERDLVAGGAEDLVQTLSRWGVGAVAARAIGDQVEAHAARTLYDQHPAPLPAGFGLYVSRLTEPEPVAA